MTLQNLLKNPLYAGAYAYGPRAVDPRGSSRGGPARAGGCGRRPSGCVLLPDRLPGLHRLGAVRAQPGAAAREPGAGRDAGRGAAGDGACWPGSSCARGAGTASRCATAGGGPAHLCVQSAAQRLRRGAVSARGWRRPLDQYVSQQVLAALAARGAGVVAGGGPASGARARRAWPGCGSSGGSGRGMKPSGRARQYPPGRAGEPAGGAGAGARVGSEAGGPAASSTPKHQRVRRSARPAS